MEKYAVTDNISKEFPFVDLLTDDEVKRKMENEIANQFDSYNITEWNAHDVPMGFGRRMITCRFEVN